MSSIQTTKRSAPPASMERGVPKPTLGPQGKNQDSEPDSKSGGQSKQVHNHKEDPFSILDANQSYHQQIEQLRDSFIVYKERCSRCRIQLRHKQAQEQFKKFYFQPKVPFLEDPETQKNYRKNLIAEVSRLPEPEPLYLMADSLHLDCLETIGDRSNPAVMRETLGRFYLRRAAQLQHKKYKLLIRWANSSLRANDLDSMSKSIDHHVGILQQEMDMCNNRLERLIPDDKFQGAAEAERPSPTTKVKHQPSDANEIEEDEGLNNIKKAAYKEELTKLYIEKTDERSVNSAIRQDDFEVYMRLQTYKDKLHRVANKLANKVKWIPHLKRFDLWKESREQIFEYRQTAVQERSNMLQHIQLDIKSKLDRLGEQDEKAITAVTERYIFHLKQETFVSRMDQIMRSHQTDVKKPFMLFASNIELKIKMKKIAESFPSLSCNQMEIDNGQQFTYQMQTLFPLQFEKQVVLAQFEVEDTGKDPDRQLLERLIKNLGLSRFQILQEITKYADYQRKSSILGALDFDSQIHLAEESSFKKGEQAESQEEFNEQNLIRKIKTIEFFTLNELKLKLRHADWLEYVCFEPSVSEYQKKQNNLLSSEENQVDNLLKGAFDTTDMHDQVSVNKILEEAAVAHIAKVTAMQHSIIQGQDPTSKSIRGRDANTEGLGQTLKNAVQPDAVNKQNQDSALTDGSKVQQRRFENIQNIDQLQVSLVKNYYSLRILKSREYKQKLLSIVNYFRAVQRILALDLKEHVTREKGVGDKQDLIEPHFGKDGTGKGISKQAPQTGPGKIFGINIHRKMDNLDHEPGTHDPVTINCYKYNGMFNPKVLSTCPMLPKYHRTFGRPSLYESMSEEMDRKTNLLHASDEMKSFVVKRDRIVVIEEKSQVHVYNEFGQPIIYDEALTDMVALEEELIKIGSYFINQHEYIQANTDIEQAQAKEESKLGNYTNIRPSSMIDRQEICLDLLEAETNYQFSKVKLLEKLLESYEHIYDPLESVRCLQMIVDLMSARPRLNMDASLYNDSYESEIKLLDEKFKFFNSFMSMQTDHEQEENKQAYDFQEMKVRRVSEAVCEEFRLISLEKVSRIGSEEADNAEKLSDEAYALEQKIAQRLEGQQAKKDALAEIQKKHITEYANEQYTNFATVLGLPEISMEDLVNKRDQQEPIITDAIREQAYFTKQLEGYPTYFGHTKFTGATVGLHLDQAGMLDFYESLSIVPKINAAIFQAFESLEDSLKPENGLAASILELCMLREVRLLLTDFQEIQNSGGQDVETVGQNYLEEDFYIGNSDKIVFTMKEFKAEMDPNNLYKSADPLVVSKLDMKSVKNYNFPRINMNDVRVALEDPTDLVSKYGTETANDKIVRRMIDLAKSSAARQLLNKSDKIQDSIDYDDDYEHISVDDKTVRSPSMMRMACNMMEVIRLREELIQRVSECNILTKIYQQQFQQAGRSQKVMASDQIPFNTSSILKDQINIVDSNHGKNKIFELPFMEYDAGLCINLDLKNESCIKALMTDLGLEELRGIVHYQIMHQQLLTVGVLTNQLVIDGPVRGLKEIELLEKSIAVPNPVLKLASLTSQSADVTNIAALKSERLRLKACISKSHDCMYNIVSKKVRDKDCVSKKFSKLQSQLGQTQDVTPELQLRILRSYRLKLLHEVCSNVMDECYIDSMKVQNVQTCNELRKKATLLPFSKTNRLFTLGSGAVMENMSAYAQIQLLEESLQATQTVDIRDILSGQILNSSLFYIPHSEELIMLDRVQVDDLQNRHQQWLEVLETDYMTFDDEIKAKVVRPVMLNEPFQPGITHLKQNMGQVEKKVTQILPQNRVMNQIKSQSGPSKRTEETRLQMYKVHAKSRQKYGYRKVNFQEAKVYADNSSYRLLQYVTLILRIFNLEYLMGRNNAPAKQILEMEGKILTGCEFWTEINRRKTRQDINMLRYGDHADQIKANLVQNETASERVIDRILERNKVYQELSEDMLAVQERVSRVDALAKNMPQDRRNIWSLIDLLILQHQATFYHFLNGLENILEIYRDKHQDEQFFKVFEVRDQAIQRRQGLILNLNNGFYISQAAASPSYMNVKGSDVDEFAQFMQQHHPMIDERALIPKQVNMMQRVYGVSADLDTLGRETLIENWNSNYAKLQSAFINLDDKSRSFIGSNFSELDELVKHYLIFKGLLEKPSAKNQNPLSERSVASNETSPDKKKQLPKGVNYTSEYLLASVEILSFKIEAAHMQRVLMGWISGEGKIPTTTKGYTQIMRKYQDITTLRILRERDHLNEIYFVPDRQVPEDQQVKRPEESPSPTRRDKQILLSPETRKTAKFAFFDKVNLIRAETNVIKSMLDQKLIQIATRMITNEHSALSAAIDFAGSQDVVQEFVHPQQQFASTLLQDVDKLGHLDVVQKVGFVQQFLTRLRNRCTEVDTLTSGPGIVFSIKDFNECVSIFCKQALKYGEENLRQRSETHAIMSNQYRHIIYLKEMEIVYYRSKCEQFLRNIDVIVNTKMSAKGNQMIYELDVTNRELRALKDHYFLMERFMRQEINEDFQKDLSTKQNKITMLNDNFGDYKNKMQHELQQKVAREIIDVEENIFKEFKGNKASVARQSGKGRGGDAKGEQEMAENYTQILHLERHIRQSKAFNLMKQVINEEKHVREIKELKLKLTLNASLWEQLSESQKRESITRQELELTKRNLTHYEKLIERLYVQLEQLNNEKVRLQRYKSSKQKKISELENKMKDLEILENIDLDKILTEMRLRDKKIVHLQHVEDEFENRMENQENRTVHAVKNIEKILAQEREAKNEAFAKLESMRIEMKALEGTDIKNDLWKDKCKELYEISRELELENDGLRSGLKQLQVEKSEIAKYNDQLVQQHQKFMTEPGTGTEPTLADTQLHSQSSRNPGAFMKPQVRENMILNRKMLTKPLTAKTTSYGQKRAQSGNPGAARNRLYQRNMTNAQSYHYERGQVGMSSCGNEQMQQTLLSNNTSYPAFSSDVDINLIGVKQGLGQQRTMPVANKYVSGGNQALNVQHRYSAGGQPGNQRMPNINMMTQARKTHTQTGQIASTRTIGLAGSTAGGVNSTHLGQHGVLAGNIIANHASYPANMAKNSSIQIGSSGIAGGSQPGTLMGAGKPVGQRLNTSHGGRAVGSRARMVNVLRADQAQMGVVGSTLSGSTQHPNPVNFADSNQEMNLESKQQIALNQASMTGSTVNIQQAEYHMQQEMKNLLQNNSSAVAHYANQEFPQDGANNSHK